MSDRADELLREFVVSIEIAQKEKWRDENGSLSAREPWISLARKGRAYLSENQPNDAGDAAPSVQPPRLTAKERTAIRHAISFVLAGETDDFDRDAAESALGKLA